MTTSRATKQPVSNRSPRNECLAHALGAALGMPPARHTLRDIDHDQARELLPGWAVEIRVSTYPRLRGWWQCALDRAANHGGQPLLIYRINDAPWRAILAIRDLAPELATAPPQLTTEMDLIALAAILHAQRGHGRASPETRIAAGKQRAGIAQG